VLRIEIRVDDGVEQARPGVHNGPGTAAPFHTYSDQSAKTVIALADAGYQLVAIINLSLMHALRMAVHRLENRFQWDLPRRIR